MKRYLVLFLTCVVLNGVLTVPVYSQEGSGEIPSEEVKSLDDILDGVSTNTTEEEITDSINNLDNVEGLDTADKAQIRKTLVKARKLLIRRQNLANKARGLLSTAVDKLEQSGVSITARDEVKASKCCYSGLVCDPTPVSTVICVIKDGKLARACAVCFD